LKATPKPIRLNSSQPTKKSKLQKTKTQVEKKETISKVQARRILLKSE
jgi:hypothetical protein